MDGKQHSFEAKTNNVGIRLLRTVGSSPFSGTFTPRHFVSKALNLGDDSIEILLQTLSLVPLPFRQIQPVRHGEDLNDRSGLVVEEKLAWESNSSPNHLA